MPKIKKVEFIDDHKDHLIVDKKTNMSSITNWNLRPVLIVSVFLLLGIAVWSQGTYA